VGRIASATENWRDTCPVHGGCARVAILTVVSMVEPQNHLALRTMGFRLGFGLKTQQWQFGWKLEAARGVITEGASIRSNSM
jgi:hypothetical protein